jgi:hypothetical protein
MDDSEQRQRAGARPSDAAVVGPPTIGLPQLEPDPEAPVRSQGADSNESTAPHPAPAEQPKASAPGPVRASDRPTREVPMQRAIEAEPARPSPKRAGAAATSRPRVASGQRDSVPKPAIPEPAELQLDLEGVKRPDRSELAGAVTVGVADSSTSASWSQTRVYGTVTAEPRRLLGTDPVAALFGGLAIGVGVGLVAALVVTRGVTAERVLPLEEELAESLSRASEVERGRLRPPAAVEADLEKTLDESRKRFFLVWLATAIPLGLLLGRLRIER